MGDSVLGLGVGDKGTGREISRKLSKAQFLHLPGPNGLVMVDWDLDIREGFILREDASSVHQGKEKLHGKERGGCRRGQKGATGSNKTCLVYVVI